MKGLVISLVFALFIQPAVAQHTSDFQDLKTGKFTYVGKEGETEIIRTKRKQVETFNGGKSKLILKIKWMNDSTYILTHKKAINAPGCLQKNDWINVVITRRWGNRFECSCSSENCGQGQIVFVKLD